MSTTSSLSPTIPTMSHDTEKQAASTSPSLSTHHEHHSTTPEYLAAAVLGMADGLTVPFALTAGLSSLNSSKLVIIGGLAEVFSGMLSMGLGEYLSSSTRAKQWEVEYARETREVREMPQAEEEEIYEIFEPFGIERQYVHPIVERLKKDEKAWVDFMMAFELKLEKPRRRTAWICALIMGLSYLIGGIIPMIPYFAMKKVTDALFVSIAVTVVVLILFGYAKAAIAGNTRKACFLSSVQTLAVGVMAAGLSYGVVYGINKKLSGGSGII